MCSNQAWSCTCERLLRHYPCISVGHVRSFLALINTNSTLPITCIKRTHLWLLLSWISMHSFISKPWWADICRAQPHVTSPWLFPVGLPAASFAHCLLCPGWYPEGSCEHSPQWVLSLLMLQHAKISSERKLGSSQWPYHVTCWPRYVCASQVVFARCWVRVHSLDFQVFRQIGGWQRLLFQMVTVFSLNVIPSFDEIKFLSFIFQFREHGWGCRIKEGYIEPTI